MDVAKAGNRERGTGNGERGTGNGEWGTGNEERGTSKGNGRMKTGNKMKLLIGLGFKLGFVSNFSFSRSLCSFPAPRSPFPVLRLSNTL